MFPARSLKCSRSARSSDGAGGETAGSLCIGSSCENQGRLPAMYARSDGHEKTDPGARTICPGTGVCDTLYYGTHTVPEEAEYGNHGDEEEPGVDMGNLCGMPEPADLRLQP